MSRFTKIVGGDVYTPSGMRRGATVVVEDRQIAEISDGPVEIDGAEIIDAKGLKVVPGGIDLHFHGGGGRDFMEGTEEAFKVAMEVHVKHGMTGCLPTVAACPVQTIRDCAEVSRKIMADPASPMIGMHLEGPYLNPKKVGAIIPEYVTPPIPADYESILDEFDVIKRWDASPELPGMEAFGKCLAKHGVLASIAHTVAEYEDVRKAYEAGFTHATHFYNAMTNVHNVREYKHEGTVESIYLIPEMTVEVIADGKHVPPTILKLIWMIKGADRTALISDSLACAASDSSFIFDPRVVIHDGVCKLSDHSALAGSIATMDRLVRTMTLEAGIPFADVVKMSAETPARILGISDQKGALARGLDADIAIYDADIRLKFVMQRGRIAADEL